MKHNIFIPGVIFLCCAFIGILNTNLFAKGHKNKTQKLPLAIFSKENRPAAVFDHKLHEDVLGNTGCAKCHHVLDTAQNKLIYSEGEETACYECHSSEPKNEILSLREANHTSCTGCHRVLKKEKKLAGPTTCGECHKK